MGFGVSDRWERHPLSCSRCDRPVKLEIHAKGLWSSSRYRDQRCWLRPALSIGFNSRVVIGVILTVAASMNTYLSLEATNWKESAMVITPMKKTVISVTTSVAALLVSIGAGVVTAGLT